MQQPSYSFLEENDEKIIHSAIEKVSENNTENLRTHVIYAGGYYNYGKYYMRNVNNSIFSFVQRGLQIHNLKSTFVTGIDMFRHFLITKEKMEDICLGKSEVYGILRKESINDDIGSVFESLRLGEKPEPLARPYFLPKLTQRELELIETKDEDYFQTFFRFKNPDVDEKEMKLSESNSKYVEVVCWRRTNTVENPSFQDLNSNIGLINMSLDSVSYSSHNFAKRNLHEEDFEDQSQHQKKFHCCCLQ